MENAFLLRLMKPGDEEGMIACIRDEYGDTYFKSKFYDKDYLTKEWECGHIIFLVAEVIPISKEPANQKPYAGEIAGMMILKKFYPKESMCEIASQIIRKKYRGYGLAMRFFEFGMQILQSQDFSAAYCLPVFFHNVTQRLLQRFGMTATGLVLNVFDVENISHSYDNGRNVKHSQGIQIKAIGKKDAGKLYLPEVHKKFCKEIYDRIGVKYEIAVSKYTEQMPSFSKITYVQNPKQESLEIRIYCVGADFNRQIGELYKKYPLQGKQTANIFLNINDPMAVWAYERLRESGWFFTGLKPLCSNQEYMVLHHFGEVQIYFEDYVVTEEFKQILNYVRKGE